MSQNIINQIKDFVTVNGLSHTRAAKMFNQFCLKKVIIISDKEIYLFNTSHKYYQKIKREHLMNIVEEVILSTLKAWAVFLINYKEDENQKQLKEILTSRLDEAIQKMESTPYQKNVLDQIISKNTITPEEYENLNHLPNYLNFRNCKVNLKTLEIEDRTEKDFITEYLNYDFHEKCDKTIKKEVLQIIKNICNDDETDLDFILRYLAYGITSETREQKYLNCLGPQASNGKSTLIKITEQAFDIYTFKSDKRQFSENFSKGHKFFSQMKNKRIVYIEELDKKKIDGDLLKDTVDGNKMNNEVLFGTTEKIKINFKLFFFSNNLMNFDSDQGIRRRAIMIYFKNKFVDPEDYEKECQTYTDGNVYKKDLGLVQRFENDDRYKLAFVHILLKYARKYFTDGIVVPDKYKKTTNDICDENDKMKGFIDNGFEITGNKEDRINWREFHDLYNKYTNFNNAWPNVLSEIKKCSLQYDGDARSWYNGISTKKSILGIKKRQQEETVIEPEFIEENPLDFVSQYNNKDDDDKHDAEIKQLKGKLSIQRAEIIQHQTTAEHYKSRVDTLEEQLAFMRKEIELLKANQTQSTTSPVSSNKDDSDIEEPIQVVKQAKKSLFLKLVAEAEEVVPKKCAKHKKIEDKIQDIETDLVEFIEC